MKLGLIPSRLVYALTFVIIATILAARPVPGLDFCATHKLSQDRLLVNGEFTPDPGNRSIPFIMVDFPDRPGTETVVTLDSLLFGSDSTGVTGYFDWLSYDRVSVTGAVLGTPIAQAWYTLDSTSYYLSLPEDSARRASALAHDMLAAADDSVNFALFDGDGDDVVECAAIIVSGCGLGGGRLITPQWWRNCYATTNDGVTIRHVMFVPEYYPNGAYWVDCDHPLPLSVVVHEIGHEFGLPDLWAGDDNDPISITEALGVWDIMGYGALGAGYRGWGPPTLDVDHPSNLNPWMKAELGWLQNDEIADITTSQRVAFLPYEDSPSAAILWVDRSSASEEFFTIAYWAKTGYQSTLPDSGLLIWHFEPKRPLNDRPWPWALEQADGLYQLEHSAWWGDDGDPFPHESNYTFPIGGRHPNSQRNPDGSPGGPPWVGDSTDIAISVDVSDNRTADISLLSQAPPPPTLLWPLDDGVAGSNVELVVENATRLNDAIAYSYEFELTDENEQSILSQVVAEGLNVTSVQSTDLTPGLTYFWRVRTVADSVNGAWTDRWRFDVGRDFALIAGGSGSQVGSAIRVGDCNGDGTSDLVLTRWNPTQGGHVELAVVFGDTALAHVSEQFLDLSALDGVIIQDLDASVLATNVAFSVGDLDNDGIEDIAIGSPEHSQGGRVFVIFGRSSGSWPTDLDAADVTIGLPTNSPYRLGEAVSVADVDGDGVEDLLIGMPASSGQPCGSLLVPDPCGIVWSLWGGSSFPTQDVEVTSIATTSRARLYSSLKLGTGVAAGDFYDDDGSAELLVGLPSGGIRVAARTSWREAPYQWSLDSPSIRLTDVMPASGATKVEFASTGDINGDGLPDLLITGATSDSSRIWIVQGTSTPDTLSDPLYVPTYADGIVTFASDAVTLPVAFGELTGDGYEDVVTGSGAAGQNGAYYLIAGESPLDSDIRLYEDPPEAYYNRSGDYSFSGFGSSVAVGDFDGDLVTDIAVGSPDLDLSGYGGPSDCGGVSIYFGPFDNGLAKRPAAASANPIRLETKLSFRPNPTSEVGQIQLDIDREADVLLEIFDVQGRSVRLLIEGKLGAGSHGFVWDGRDGDGRPLSAGMYFARLTADSDPIGTMKLVILR